MMLLFLSIKSIFFFIYFYWCICQKWVCDKFPSLEFIVYKSSLNQLTNLQKKLAWISTHPLFTEPDGTFGHHQASFNTTDAELWNFSVLASWLCAIMSKSPLSMANMWPPSLLLSGSIKYSQSYFFENREQAPSQFSLSAPCIKVLYTQPFSQRFHQRFTLLSENNCSV